MRMKGPTTNRVQRHEIEPAEVRLVLEPTALLPAPPVPSRPPRSLGDFSRAPATDIVDAVGKHFGCSVGKKQRAFLRGAIGALLEDLEQAGGQTWQERWEAAGLNERGRLVGDAAGEDMRLRKQLTSAASLAFAMRLIRPSLFAFRSYKFVRFSAWFRSVANDPLLEEFCARSERLPVGEDRQAKARSQLFAALTVFGIDLADLTPEALLYYAVECRDHGLSFEDIQSRTFAGTLAWTVLHDMGRFTDVVPRTLRGAVTRGQMSVEEAVDRYHLDNQAVRDLLVAYIRQRAVVLDYSTRGNLIHQLVL
ncbi:hypothetical protein [Streptomyces sp. NBC_00328]|uniref:hypothetical protein n=1 Tax=Streptomyces sp. NBC_00328 TaxID=2903646 RepID=UPI002E2A27EE|nr:hypothetical protein [Streptomyces sp. NBC_00328]